MHIDFSSLKTHVRWHIRFSSFYQLWFFELENPCVLTHMVFKVSSTLEFQPWKPYALDFQTWKPAYGFQDVFYSRFLSLKTHVCWCIWFSNYFQFWISRLKTHVCRCIWFSSSLQFFDFWALKPMCAGTCGFQATLNSSYQTWFQDLFDLAIIFKLSNVFNECKYWFFCEMMLLPHRFCLNQQHL
jgi:hypothetical protein